MIQISKLPLVTTPEEFFSIEKILYVEILAVDTAPKILKRKLVRKFGAFMYNEKLYWPFYLKGSPENLFLKLKDGFPFDFGDGDTVTVTFDGLLQDALDQKKVYDFSEHYKSGKHEFAKELDFLAESYIIPYEKNNK